MTKPASSNDQDPRDPAEEISATESFKEAFERLEADVRAAEDKYLRALADLDNNRKHLAREKANWLRYGHEALARDLLPILDNLERAIESAGTLAESPDGAEGAKGLLEGVALILRQFSETLSKHGVSAIDSEGRPFDPRFHEAVQRIERSDVPPGTIIEAFQKGYMLHDRLLRASKVVVSAESESERNSEGGPDGECPGQGGAEQ
ncbi:MAG: nucleotide exchange factor GrpE [Myxococcota bacterium]